LQKLIPFGLYIVGWGSVFLGIVMRGRES